MRNKVLFVSLMGLAALGFRFGGLPFAPEPAFQDQEANIEFDWAFGVVDSHAQMPAPLPITHDTVLRSSDEIKMMVKLTKECYVYAVYLGSQGELALLFPYSIRQLQNDYTVEKPYYIPKGRSWMILDNNKGKEIFFLIASTKRLLDLEIKLGNYYSADPSERKPLAQSVVSEIRGLRKSYSTFATIAEKPLTIGGNIRSTDTVKVSRRLDIADIAVHISAQNFYSKTITIDHQ
jgi:hypothetical protein